MRTRHAVATAFALLAFGALAGAAAGSYPRPARACGTIEHGGKAIAVDIAEADAATLACSGARDVMSAYLHRAARRTFPNAGRNLTIRLRGRTFDCYTSRPDGVGWDFHCDTYVGRQPRYGYVDVGAGRRGHLCRSADPRRCPPG